MLVELYMFWKLITLRGRWILTCQGHNAAVTLQAVTNLQVVECKPNLAGLGGGTAARSREK